MSKQSITVAGVLAVAAGWLLWVTRDVSSPIPAAATGQAAEADKPAPAPVLPPHSEPVRAEPTATAEPAGTAEPVPEQAETESAAQVDPLVSTTIAGDFPSYLEVVKRPGPFLRTPRGCKLFFEVLADMSNESRDELWAPRVERELRALLPGRHPLGFPISVGCRATTCQVTATGPHAALGDMVNNRAVMEFWRHFAQSFQSDPLASEFATMRFFAGGPPEGMNIMGYVFTSVGQGTPSEPPDCATIHPPGSDSPPNQRNSTGS